MTTVELRFSAQPEHVRTARLVAAAVARRAGVDEAVLDEVRLAVGEACSRAVGRHRSHGITSPIEVVLTEEDKTFSIAVGDEVPASGSDGSAGPADGRGGDPRDAGDSAADGEDDMGLAVISGLVDDMEVSTTEEGGVIRMSWPKAQVTALP